MALLCNVTGANPGSIGSDVARIFLGEDGVDEEEERPQGIAMNEDRLQPKTGIYMDPNNYLPIRIVLEDDSLRLQNGTALIPVAGNRFRVGTVDTEYLFTESEETGKHGIRVFREGFSEQFHPPVEEFDDEADLTAFEGTYYGADEETSVTVTLNDEEKLVLKRRPADEFEMVPVYKHESTLKSNFY